jgi:hypothetical protein
MGRRRGRRKMTEDKKEKFELDFAIGKSGYFLRKSSSGMVAGPRQSKDGVPRPSLLDSQELGTYCHFNPARNQ